LPNVTAYIASSPLCVTKECAGEALRSYAITHLRATCAQAVQRKKHTPLLPVCATTFKALRLCHRLAPHSIGDERLPVVKGLVDTVKVAAPALKVHLHA